jgi:tRNA threonylcarbamoyladenosine biosynthesis protein TsaB
VTDITRLVHSIQQPTLVAGELKEEERRALARKYKNVHLASPAQALRRPAFLAELAWKRWQSGQVDDPTSLAPLYLHFGDPIPG